MLIVKEESEMKLISTTLIALSLASAISVLADIGYQQRDHRIIQPVKCEDVWVHECKVHKYCSWDKKNMKCERLCSSYKKEKKCRNDKTCSWMSIVGNSGYCLKRGNLG